MTRATRVLRLEINLMTLISQYKPEAFLIINSLCWNNFRLENLWSDPIQLGPLLLFASDSLTKRNNEVHQKGTSYILWKS